MSDQRTAHVALILVVLVGLGVLLGLIYLALELHDRREERWRG